MQRAALGGFGIWAESSHRYLAAEIVERVATKAEALPNSSPDSGADAYETSQLDRRDDTCSCLGLPMGAVRWSMFVPMIEPGASIPPVRCQETETDSVQSKDMFA